MSHYEQGQWEKESLEWDLESREWFAEGLDEPEHVIHREWGSTVGILGRF